MTDEARSVSGRPALAVRLICTVQGDEVRVASRRRLTKIVPPSEPLAGAGSAQEGEAARSGFWLEVRDAADQVRYRRVVPDPLAAEVEVPGPEGSFTRRPAAPGAFALLVPDLPGADHVSLIRSGPLPVTGRTVSALAARTGEVARLALHDDPGDGRAEDGADGRGGR